VPGPVRVAQRGGGGGGCLVLKLDEAEAPAVARLPVAHDDDGAHLAEAREVGPQVFLLRPGRDPADEELAALGSILHRRRQTERESARVLREGSLGARGGRVAGWLAGGVRAAADLCAC
jgi:hypothetical protein